MPRVAFDELPATTRQAVTMQTGHIVAAHTAGGGINSAIAALLDTEKGPVFVKGIPTDNPQVASQEREIAISPHLPASCPRLLWHVEAGGWVLLGYEAVDGRHADYTATDDLNLVLVALAELQEVIAPDDIELKTAAERWGKYTEEGQGELFAGDTLLHTDFAPDNVLIHSGRARLIDWAWPTRGAAWIDPFMLALRIMETGATAAQAVSWVQRVPSWRESDPKALGVFATAVTRLWREIAAEDPAPWKVAMAGHAAQLKTHLFVTPWPY
ncbi:aminoglycoside phosphotransferase family protein [Streptomyces phaeochromogenes]|uniref:aminoglycoside phosphotransferase n=1 Tax=Streptomyces phaeochromogenes TaxID=1923 RepID=UPI0022551596|nr:aminoglycoside phosphotransferase [Streptomyces phaeochromogenes]MCX5597182.1 aminoglycoside phosphotransferase family protein [Streptomyces phaeochromogenes]